MKSLAQRKKDVEKAAQRVAGVRAAAGGIGIRLTGGSGRCVLVAQSQWHPACSAATSFTGWHLGSRCA